MRVTIELSQEIVDKLINEWRKRRENESELDYAFRTVASNEAYIRAHAETLCKYYYLELLEMRKW